MKLLKSCMKMYFYFIYFFRANPYSGTLIAVDGIFSLLFDWITLPVQSLPLHYIYHSECYVDTAFHLFHQRNIFVI